MIEYINARCLAWAEYSKRKTSGKLGYPKQSAFARLMPSGTCVVPIDEGEVNEIERAVLGLNQELKGIVKAMYLQGGTIEQKARDVGCCRDTFYTRLHRSHILIMEWLQDHAPADFRKTG